MKKIFSNVMLVAAAAMTFFGCQKPEMISPEYQTVNGLVFGSEKPSFNDETKTEWTGETIQWSKGDKIRVAYTCDGVWQNADGTATADEEDGQKTAKLYASDGLDASKEVATFVVPGSFKGNEAGVYQFYGIYPSTLTSSTSISHAPSVTIDIPSVQTPTANSFDVAADVMVSQSEAYSGMPRNGDKNGAISLKWNRLVAHGHLTLNALAVDGQEKVESIVLTANSEVDMVGEHYVDFETKVVTKSGEAATNVITIDGTNLSIDANGNVSFWVSFLPCTWTSLTVEVETNKASYTREIDLSANQKTFVKNARNVLGIGMASATRVTKETESWVLVTPADGITEGTYALVASTSTKTGVLVSTNGSSSAPAFNTGITIEDNVLKGVAESMQFDIAGTAGNYVIYVAGGTSKWLYCTNTNNGVRVGTNTNKTWTISAHNKNINAFTFKHNATNRYLGVYNNQDWRCYDALTKLDGVTGNTGAIYLYKKTSGPVAPDTTPSVELETEVLELTAEESEGTIKVEAKNIESIEVRALVEEGSQNDSDWLVAEYDEANSCITYSAPANELEDPRIAYIEVYCLDAEGNEIVAGVNVTQEGVATEPAGPQVVTVAEFLAAAVGDKEYQLTGVMSGTYNTTYGNFYLEDETGKVLVYGLTKTKVSENDKSFASIGLRDGDTLTLIGTRADYNGTAQVGGPAYYIGHVAAPYIDLDNAVATVDAEATTYAITVTSNCAWTATASTGVTLDKSSATGNATINMTFAANKTEDAVTYTVTFTSGSLTQTFTLTQNGVVTGDTVEPVKATLSFADKAQRTTFTTSQQIWEQNGIKVINNKASSTNAVADYAKPARFYAGSNLEVTAPGAISMIVFDANSSSYATAMKNSIGTVSGANVAVSSDKVTITFSTPVASFTVAKFTAQVRMDSMDVTYIPED